MLKNAFIAFVFLITLVITIRGQHRSKRPPLPYQNKSLGLQLPDNATSIRENIVDTFSCENRIYGYYADVDNECQVFHVCVSQTRHITRYSFICPAETVFNQVTFVCSRIENSIPCEESEKYYNLNEQFGKIDGHTNESMTEHNGNEIDLTTHIPHPSYSSQRSTKSTLGSTHYPVRPTYPTTTQDHWNSYRPTSPSPTVPDYWTTQSSQRHTRLPDPHTSIPDYSTTNKYPYIHTKHISSNGTPDWLTLQYPNKSTKPSTYPSSVSTLDHWTTQSSRQPTRLPNRLSVTPHY